MDRKLKQAGLVIKKSGDINKEKLMDSLAAVMTVLPNDKRDDLEIIEGNSSFVIELSHYTSIIFKEEIENVLGLHVVPLVDAREGLIEITEDENTGELLGEESEEDLDEEDAEEKSGNEPRSPSKPVVPASFQELVQRHEAASKKGDEISVPPLFSYIVPEDKESPIYEEKRKLRLAEMEGICKQGASKLCRASSVWKGVKEKEDIDKKWAEEKLRLLRAERGALRDGNPSEAKKLNYRVKMHEKCPPAQEKPDKKRELERSGNSPTNSKIPKTTTSSKEEKVLEC